MVTHPQRSKHSPHRRPTPDELRRVIEDADITQQEVSKRLSCSLRTVESWLAVDKTEHSRAMPRAAMDLLLVSIYYPEVFEDIKTKL